MKKTQLIDLGVAPYHQVWELQEQLLKELQQRRDAGEAWVNHLILVEHPHVYTLGKSGHEENFLEERMRTMSDPVECIRVNRGGDITYHGPGQLVVYPILDMQSFGVGVKSYVERLEAVVIDTLADYAIEAGRIDGATGVWLQGEPHHTRKICAIGVKCSKFVTMHGLALNINTNLDYFNFINPCGFVDKGVTSIERERGLSVAFDEVKRRVVHHFVEHFGMELVE